MADRVQKLSAIPALAAALLYYFNENPSKKQSLPDKLTGDFENDKVQLTLYLNIANTTLLFGYALIQIFRHQHTPEIEITLRRLSTLLLILSSYLSALMNNTQAILSLFLVGLINLIDIFHEPKRETQMHRTIPSKFTNFGPLPRISFRRVEPLL